MPLSVDATVGGAASTSFVTVTEADTYLSFRLNSAAWTGADPKCQALVEATRDLSALAWQGYRVDDMQALSWPRANAPNPDGISDACFDTTEIPQRIKDATCELALEFLRAGTTDVAALDSKAGVIEKTVGPLTTRWQAGQRPTGLARYPRVMQLIAPLLGIGSGQVRLVR